MRLICPNCDAQYEVDASMLPVKGRDVQCSACGKVWFFVPPTATEELPPAVSLPKAAPPERPSDRRASNPDQTDGNQSDWDIAGADASSSRPPVPEARFLSDDDDNEEDGDLGLTPKSTLEWQTAWNRALSTNKPGQAPPRSETDEDLDEDFAEELRDLSAQTPPEPLRSRTEIAARRAHAVLSQEDPPAGAHPAHQEPHPAEAEAPQPLDAPRMPDQSDAWTPGEPYNAAGDAFAADHFDGGPVEEGELPPPPPLHGRDEPRFDDSPQTMSPGVPVQTTTVPPNLNEAVAARRRDAEEPQDGLDPIAPEDFPTEALLRRLRRSRPDLPPEPEEEFELPFDEEEGVDPLPRRPKIDEDKLALLREEAERETRARAAEAARAASRALEMQPDLGLTEGEAPARLHIGPRSAPPEQDLSPALLDTGAPQSRGPRRELLPDIERINQTLSASGATHGKSALPPLQAVEAQRRGFRRGFVVALLIAVLLALAYQNAAWLSERLPALRPMLEGYVALIDTARLGIDQLLRSLLDSQTL